MAALLKEYLGTSYLFGANAPFIEELYEAYLADPTSVAPEWRTTLFKASFTARKRLRRVPTSQGTAGGSRSMSNRQRMGVERRKVSAYLLT